MTGPEAALVASSGNPNGVDPMTSIPLTVALTFVVGAAGAAPLQPDARSQTPEHLAPLVQLAPQAAAT